MMLEGLSIAPAGQTWLAHAESPRLLHVFGPACNLIDTRGKLFSLVLQSVGPQPFALVARPKGDSDAVPFAFSRYLRADSPVKLESQRLTIGPLVVNTGSAIRWLPNPPWSDIPPIALNKSAKLISELLAREAPRESIAASLAGPPSGAFQQRVTMAWRTLSEGILASDGTLCRMGAAGLAGLGPGLTPAGDDFLVGVLYGLWASRPVAVAARLAEVIAEEASARTTRLSAAWLRAASTGEAGETWHRLWQAVIADDSQQTLTASRRIRATGETSGADALAGLIAALGLLQD